MRELRAQFVNALLVILTVAAVICAGINYQQQKKFSLPDDGVTWMDVPDARPGGPNHVTAFHLVEGGPADIAGIRQGDEILRIGTNVNPNGAAIQEAIDVPRVLERIGVWGKAEYTVQRGGIELKAIVIVADSTRDSALYLQYGVGCAWLGIGLFLFFRRRRAPRSTHFYLLCLASFVLYTFHYTGKLNNFDVAMYVGNVLAGMLAPALFLHFCMTFPEPRKGWGPWKVVSVYVPALSLVALQIGIAMGAVRTAIPLIEMRWLLDRAWLLFFSVTFLAGGFILHLQSRRADDPIIRQQVKWLRNGVLAGVIPFVAFYAAPYIAGVVPSPLMRMSVLFLAIVPLTWAYAILRYRLMDVDIIFQQGYVYVLATLSVLGIVYMLVFALSKREELSPTAVVLLVLVAAFVFEPLRNWIQQQLDRYIFYKDRYDYRNTLIAFARELSSEMDLDRTLHGVGERLISTLQVAHVAFFLSDEHGERFALHSALDREGQRRLDESQLDLSFLSGSPAQPYLFFERTRHAIDVVTRELPQTVRATISELDLTYYLPCVFRGRTLAWLGVSRSIKGDFLSTDDIDLLNTLSGYVGMAVENARLYNTLAAKAEQYERLKEFSENIVESINVGILAADLDDRVESWNSRLERMTGIPRYEAVGRTLRELFPAEMFVHFDNLRGENTIHQLYKLPLKTHSAPNVLASATALGAQNGVARANGSGNGNGANSGTASAAPQGQPGETARDALVNVAIAPLVTKDGQRIGRLVIFDDVTEREDLERRLVQADKLSSIGLLAAGVAHEVNTPLAVISTYAQMLAKQIRDDEQKTKLLDKIAKQTFRASEIVNSLLNFSRTSSTEFVDLDLNKVVRETLSLLEHQFEKAGISIQADLLDIPTVRGNSGKLQQVFLNLFLNSRDAMSESNGGTLNVSSRMSGDSVIIEVRDSGAGIARDHLTRIFDPFFTTKTARKGTGLGLSVTYGIVEEHGGTIAADSRPGQGATFRLEFPAVRNTVNA